MKNEKLFSILIVSLFISLCGGIITFYDKNLMPQQMIPYSDNSIVFRLFERLNITCNVPNLTYKILHPNGTSNLITVYDHQISSFDSYTDKAQIEDTITNYILMIYYKNKIIEESNTTLTFGMMIDWSGRITR